jgi:murein DD-endopeptidase MepM/ murein hydrolase activator NlpD
MRRKRPAKGRLIPILVAVFVGGVATGWFASSRFNANRPAGVDTGVRPDTRTERPLATSGNDAPVATLPPHETPDSEKGFAGAPGEAEMTADPIADLKHKHLALPLDAVKIEAMKGQFADRREGSREHDAVDLLAPRNTPIHAVESGTIAKLFVSRAGGNTVYQFDPSGRYCYYYAHLQAYADGLKDGAKVGAGQILGYVGTSGNAPPNTPHLHFAIFVLGAARHWWEGKAIDPYQVFAKGG